MKQYRVVIDGATGDVEGCQVVHNTIQDGVIQREDKLIFRVNAESMAQAVEISKADFQYLTGGDFI